MAALEVHVGRPMPIEQTREDFRFHFALSELLVALLITGVVFTIRINAGGEDDVLPIAGPDAAVRAGRDVRHLMRILA